MKLARVLTLISAMFACGTFALTQTETVLHSFDGAPGDGDRPVSPLVYDADNQAFYAVTLAGGKMNSGTVFQLKQSESGEWVETILYSFQNVNDYSSPNYLTAVYYWNGFLRRFMVLAISVAQTTTESSLP